MLASRSNPDPLNLVEVHHDAEFHSYDPMPVTHYKASWGRWNFVGTFGVCNSGRADVNYEPWHGRKLDRAMVELLQAF